MTRAEHENKEGIAIAAMIGLLSGSPQRPAHEIAVAAFDCAEAMTAESKKRLGDKPGYDD